MLCLGGGSICTATMDLLLKEGCKIAVLDTDRHCAVAERCRECRSPDEIRFDDRAVLLVGDAISTAIDILERTNIDLVVPGIPGHAAGKLAMAWGKGRMSPRGSMALLHELNARLSGSGIATMDPDGGTIIATLNTGPHPCPTDCSQKGVCPLTGLQRSLDLCDVLKDALDQMSIKNLVIRTVKVGIYGVIEGKDLVAMQNLLRGMVDGDAVAIATSCSCHAILNTFKVC